MKWELSLSSGIAFSRPLLEVLPSIREAGFRRLQVAALPGHFDFVDRDKVLAVRREMDRLGLRGVSVHAPFGNKVDLTVTREEDRLAAVEEVERAVDALVLLGGKSLVLHVGSDDDSARLYRRQRLFQGMASLGRICTYCQKVGVRVAVEDLLGHLVGGRTEEVLWFAKRLPEKDSGICLDTGHSFLTGDLFGRVRQFRNRIVMVHAHDNLGTSDDHLPPGEGHIIWPELLDTLATLGFNGEFVIEINDRPGSTDLLDRARRSAVYLQSCCLGKGFSIELD